MNICVLGSGSSGNCTYIGSGETRILVDAGLNHKHTCLRLASVGLQLSQISGILFTHDHSDHCKGLPVIYRNNPLPIFANERTCTGIDIAVKQRFEEWTVFENGSAFTLGDFSILPFSVPHDASDPVAYRISDGFSTIAVITDLGDITPGILRNLADCDLIVLESNHDPVLLQESDRTHSLKQRIASRCGHLTNEMAADIVERIHSPKLRKVLLAHISLECNSLPLARKTMCERLRKIGRTDIEVHLTFQDRPGPLITL